MLEGLETAIIDFSTTLINKDFRIDSDFWTKEPKKNPNLKYDKIGNILVSAQYGISISMNEDDKGYPIYRMNEIHNMFCDLEVDKHADISKNEFEKFQLNDKDVLFNRTNSYEWVGRTGLYRKLDGKEFTFASYLVRFIPDENKVLPEYLTTFLNTKYGVWDVKRRSRQSINQTNVNPEEVKGISMPLLSMDFQIELKQFFVQAHINRIRTNELYKSAENLLLQTLGLHDFSASTDAVNIKGFKESFLSAGRLDAEYYQKKYEEITARIKEQKYDQLGNLVKIAKSIEPGSEAYQDEGIPFIRISNLTKMGLSEPDIHLDKSDFKDIIRPKKDTILLSKDGTVGIAYKVSEDMYAITSGAILHLNVKSPEVLPDYLTLVLNSKVVQMQAERDAGGSILQHWKPSEIEQVEIPIINKTIQEQIATLVQESFRLKKESEQLLELAKRAVEMAIEVNENAAIEYVENSKILNTRW